MKATLLARGIAKKREIRYQDTSSLASSPPPQESFHQPQHFPPSQKLAFMPVIYQYVLKMQLIEWMLML